MGAVGVLQIQRAVEMLDDGLGDREQLVGVVLDPKQNLAGLLGELADRGIQEVMEGFAVHAAPPSVTRSEGLWCRLAAS